MTNTSQRLTALFPHLRSPAALSAAATHVPVPHRQAGWTYESTKTVLELLKDNHQKWHIFFNDRGFHNHASHHLLAIYALGANKELLEAAYATHVAYMKPAIFPPGGDKVETIINDSNWKDYVDDEHYYRAYLAYFSAKLTEGPNAIQQVLEKYVMSADANIVPGKNGKAPLMLSRFMAGLLHPYIHAGYGVEFEIPGLVAEALAQTMAHKVEGASLFNEKLFQGDGIADITAKLATTAISSSGEKTAPHALNILSRIASDPNFAPSALGLPAPIGSGEELADIIARVASDKLLVYIEQWSQDLSANVSADVLRAKVEEIVWMNATIYGVAGWAGRVQGADPKKEFNADFLLMHIVTSALFLPPFMNTLSPKSAALLLRTYFGFSLIVYLLQGRPSFPIAEFYKATDALPSGPEAPPKFVKDTLPPQKNPNPWNQIVQTTLVHPNEHLCKLQRALLHFAEQYGGTAPGAFVSATEGAGSALTGAEALDGTLFLRVAKLTADRLGWMREGQEVGGWDRGGFLRGLDSTVASQNL
ncbi:hypothetical protein BDY19DRAFT_1059708 [Irpex rosettiformis]|uniref:Uncharacterized protein n=1 Tax=Irpex rosettiformis TaxID=378272 RepID=A0ACB8TT47_9APHY|nr:hypothetical protein BDY19DRAFT_1059708 [Irpex rosettiformis]